MTVRNGTAAARIALVGCGKAKLDHPAPARELYTSNLFRLSAAYAERSFDRWYVVSALHGLVEPDAVIAPYEYSLTGLRERELDAWAGRVIGALAHHERGANITLLAGGRYRHLAGLMRWSTHPAVNFYRGTVADVAEPLQGLGIGQRLAWLKRELEPAQDGGTE